MEADGSDYTLYAHDTVILDDNVADYTFTDLIIKTLRNYETLVKYVNAK
ncbi:hypothetical protein MGH68_06205 [Erysipelothrix sp. D19-032]